MIQLSREYLQDVNVELLCCPYELSPENRVMHLKRLKRWRGRLGIIETGHIYHMSGQTALTNAIFMIYEYSLVIPARRPGATATK